MTTPLTDERVVQLAKEHNLSSSSRGIRAHWDLMNFVKAVQQPSVAPPAPGGDVQMALARMDALLDPERNLLSVSPDSATAQGCRADMLTIRRALPTPPKD